MDRSHRNHRSPGIGRGAAAALLLSLAWPSSARAQSASDIAAWIALVSTPVGAFTPSPLVPSTSGADRRVDVRARYGHWQFASDDDNTTNLGLGVGLAVGAGRIGLDVGRTTKKDCDDCTVWMAGVDAEVPLWTGGDSGGAVVGLGLSPELGYQFSGEGSSLSSLSAALRLPLSVATPVGGRLRLAPFVSPGVGFGRISVDDDSESGQRVLLGGGVTLAEASGRFRATVGLNRIVIEEGETVFGVSLTYGR